MKQQGKPRRALTGKASVQRYNSLLLFNISKTRAELLAGKDIRRGFICFDICERGKLRHIKSVHFSERVVQKSFCTNIIYPTFTRSLIYDNGASQQGKGTQFSDQQTDDSLAGGISGNTDAKAAYF